MPKDRVEAAIEAGTGQGHLNYDEILYEGYGPHGVAIWFETATDNPRPTVANVKSHFNKGGSAIKQRQRGLQFKKWCIQTAPGRTEC